MGVAHFLAGYVWVQGAHLEDKPLLPTPFWTLSDCLCHSFPGPQGLSWVRVDASARERHRRALGVTADEIEDLQAWTDARFETGEVGWPGIFLSLPAALEFGRRFLGSATQTKLIAFAVPAVHLPFALESLTPGEDFGLPGALVMLRRRQPLHEPGWLRRGYEVLGMDVSGSAHSFVCNGLEEQFVGELGIELNRFGLIDDLEQASRAAAYCLRDDVGAEPEGWLPWLLLEPAPESAD